MTHPARPLCGWPDCGEPLVITEDGETWMHWRAGAPMAAGFNGGAHVAQLPDGFDLLGYLRERRAVERQVKAGSQPRPWGQRGNPRSRP